ncbi:MAG: lysoplasmalogenase family protein [Alkalispirochaeta sp.]
MYYGLRAIGVIPRGCTSLWRMLIVASIPAVVFDILPLKMAIPGAGAVVVVAATSGSLGDGWRLHSGDSPPGSVDDHHLRRVETTATDRRQEPWRLWVAGALLLSATGDYFMSNLSTGEERFFLFGTGIYLLVHVSYTIASLLRGAIRRDVLLGTGLVIGGVTGATIFPRIEPHTVRVPVIAYATLSVVSLAAAAGVRGGKRSRLRFVTAIVLIIVSDIAIAFKLFLRNSVLDAVILPSCFTSNLIFVWEGGKRSRSCRR